MKRVSRRGYTLVEMVAVMSTMAILLTTIGTTIHIMVRATGRLRDANATLNAWDRFSVRLQADVHRATRAQVTDNKLTLELAAGTVVYQQQGQRMVRTATNDEGGTHREYFSLPRDHVAKWTHKTDPHAMIQLKFVDEGEPDGESNAPIVATEIIAAIGLEEVP